MMLNGIQVGALISCNYYVDKVNENLILTCSTTGKIYLWDFASLKSANYSQMFDKHSNKSILSWSFFNPD